MNASANAAASPPGFAEHDFETLAAAIDAVPSAHRTLFLTKLVILLAASAPANTLESFIRRAQKKLHS